MNVGDPRRQRRFPEIEDDSSHDGDNLQVVRHVHGPRRSTPAKIARRLSFSRALTTMGSDAATGTATANGALAARSDTVCATSATELARCASVTRHSNSSERRSRRARRHRRARATTRSRASRRLTRFIEGFSSVGIGGKAIIGAQSDRRLGSRTRGRLRAGPGKKLRSFELDGRRAASDGPARLASDELTSAGAPADLYHRVVWPNRDELANPLACNSLDKVQPTPRLNIAGHAAPTACGPLTDRGWLRCR